MVESLSMRPTLSDLILSHLPRLNSTALTDRVKAFGDDRH
jgi:hypothetical protein